MEAFTIGEIANLAGVQPSTLRYYESIGILPAPRRVSGQRRYSVEVLQILAVIQLAKEANFTLPEIRALLYGFAEASEFLHLTYQNQTRRAYVAGDIDVGNNNRTEAGVAFNWFINKHNLKLQTDLRQIEDDAANTTNREARVQLQFIF